ncbi:cupredoxin domain-containing protein [Thermoflexus sp.]
MHFLSGADWQSPPLRPGQQISFTFTRPGEYRYQCDFHAQRMKGVIMVTP